MCGCTETFTCSRCKGTPHDYMWWFGEDDRWQRLEDDNDQASTVDWQNHEVKA